ncbi:MAG TPA: hypothetical protein VE997_07160 [Candidatus Limnocylindria bacterium]|nr:hypothetical protein [Candidatus Limnocylindria bacterium]
MLGVAVLMLSTPGAARAAAAPLRIDATVQANFLSTGSTNVLSGTLTDRALGSGAVLERTSAIGGGLLGHARYVDGTGTLSWSEQLSTAPGAGTTLAVTGSWKAERGTGRYASPSGNGTVSGTVDTQTGFWREAQTSSASRTRTAAPRSSATAAGSPTGTGRYAHFSSRGTPSFAGPRDPTTGVVTLTLRGALRY